MTGYYDAEGAEKCAKTSQQHEEFYADLRLRRQQSNDYYTAYTNQLNSLVSQCQEKITSHSSKFQTE